jgi:hypothetical protein
MIGYSVLYINDDTSAKDTLGSKRDVYNTWEIALDQAMSRANEEKNRYEDTYIISLVSFNSKNNCEVNGSTQVFTIQIKGYGKIGSLHIIPVYGE